MKNDKRFLFNLHYLCREVSSYLQTLFTNDHDSRNTVKKCTFVRFIYVFVSCLAAYDNQLNKRSYFKPPIHIIIDRSFCSWSNLCIGNINLSCHKITAMFWRLRLFFFNAGQSFISIDYVKTCSRAHYESKFWCPFKIAFPVTHMKAPWGWEKFVLPF